MTHDPNLTEATNWYEHFLLQDIRREDGVRQPRKHEPLDVRQYFQTAHLFRNINYETGITAEALVAKLPAMRTDYDAVIRKCQDPVRRQELRWEQADIERTRHIILTEHFPELGSYDSDGLNWRWFRPVPEPRKLSPEYVPRLGRKIMLSRPKLDLEEHQELVDQMRDLWAVLLLARANFRSADRGYLIISKVFAGFRELQRFMADEVCDILDIPEGSPTIWDGAVPPSLPRRRKGDLNTQTVDPAPVMARLVPFWTLVQSHKQRYKPQHGDLQVYGIDAACEGLSAVVRLIRPTG
jgi:hypothetical protein